MKIYFDFSRRDFLCLETENDEDKELVKKLSEESVKHGIDSYTYRFVDRERERTSLEERFVVWAVTCNTV